MECKYPHEMSNLNNYQGIKINWDTDCDTRILCWIDSLPKNIKNKIAEVGESKGTIDVVLYEPYTKSEFLQDVTLDNAGVEVTKKECVFEDGTPCYDYWNVNRVEIIERPYTQYLNSTDWKKKSTEFKKRNEGFCSLCNVFVGINNLETHHIKYPKELKNDSEKNWIAICKICHRKLHGMAELSK